MFLIVLILAVALAVLPYHLTRKEYPVHSSGVIVVTGASTGIGQHAAIALAREGYIVFAGVRKDSDGEDLKALVPSGTKGQLIPLIIDVTKDEQVKQARETVSAYLKSHSGLPFVGLVNNAGISTRCPIESVPLENGRWLFEVNFWGYIHTTQEFLPLIREHKGRIVSVSSLAGLMSLPGNGIYAASKRAMEATMDSLRLELRDFGISVSVIEPGYIITPILDKKNMDREIVTEEQKAVYEKFWTKLNKERQSEFAGAPGPEITTEVIIHSLVSPYPNTRYPVGGGKGYPGWLISILAGILPDRVADLLR